jgi:hypothetical protein
MNLHAKTYYDTPGFQGGDETYVDVNVSDIPTNNAPLPGSARGTFGSYITEARSIRDDNPFLNYIYIAVTAYDSVHEQLEGAKMVLTCWITWWITVPSGLQEPDWNAELYNSQYKVIRVTN